MINYERLYISAYDHERGLEAVAQAARAEAIEESAKCVPTNWVDQLLSGKEKVIGNTYDAQGIERLLLAIKARINALSDKSQPAEPAPAQHGERRIRDRRQDGRGTG
jgi:hypothetical protein